MLMCSVLFTVLGDYPTLLELLDLNVPLHVRDQYKKFGIILLQDERGDKMAVIEKNYGGKCEDITLEVLTEWMKGNGLSVTWDSLITALRKCGLILADQIQMALEKRNV